MITHVRALVIAASLALSGLALVSAAQADDVQVPETAAEHLALAKEYTTKASTYHAEAAEHRKMAEAYKKKAATSPKAANPWVVKMEKHCGALAKDAEKLAADAQKAAEYHTLRAKELEGK